MIRTRIAVTMAALAASRGAIASPGKGLTGRKPPGLSSFVDQRMGDEQRVSVGRDDPIAPETAA